MEVGDSTGGSAVLVHGLWGHPDDWWLVADELKRAGLAVLTQTCRHIDPRLPG